MSLHTAKVEWLRATDEAFTDLRYSRAHSIEFDGGARIAASSSPHVVKVPYSDASAIDPEEMFVASVASCHMLWFLSLAAQQGFRVDRYVDEAEGVMAANSRGKQAITRITLRPHVAFGGARQPSAGEIDTLHHMAHEECFIANSITTEVQVQRDSTA
jgi:organic hydroperoxide reductase OsmC/OhrA